jgi:hypothetical protein
MILEALAAASVAAEPPRLVCTAGYRTMSRRIAAAGLLYEPPRADRPWAEYSTAEGVRPHRRYRVSRPGAEGHPAIIETHVGASSAGVDVLTTVCCWGDPHECRNLRQDVGARNRGNP